MSSTDTTTGTTTAFTSLAAQWATPGVPRPTSPTPQPCPAVQHATLAIDALLAGPVSGRPVDVAAVLVLAERLRGAALRELGELAATGQYTHAGAPSAAVWLRQQQSIGDDAARSAVHLAARLRTDLPQIGALLTAGGTTLEHVRAVAAGTNGLDTDLIAAAQPALAALLPTAEPARVRRELRERADAIDPDLGRDTARRRQARQGLYADQLDGIGVHLTGHLAGDDAAVFLHGLDLQLHADRTAGDTRPPPARRAGVLVDWAQHAALRLTGPGDTLTNDAHTTRSHLLITCTLQQLTQLTNDTNNDSSDTSSDGPADLAGTADPAGATDPAEPAGETEPAGPAPAVPLASWLDPQALALLTGDTPSQPARLPTGTALRPEALRRLACDASLSLIITRGHTTDNNTHSSTGTGRLAVDAARQPTGQAAHTAAHQWAREHDPLYASRTTRTVTGPQWKALVQRDRHCIVRGCTRRPVQCQAHHVQHWLDGGPTDLDNLVLLCHVHHHDHHDRGHDLQHHDGRWLTATGWAHAPPLHTAA